MTPRERVEGLKRLVTVEIHQDFWNSIKHQIEQAVRAEREACAQLVDKHVNECWEKIDKMKGWKRQAAKENEMMNFADLAKEIRARSDEIEIKPHQFQGSSDRWCEICNQPDRAAIHKIQFNSLPDGLKDHPFQPYANAQCWLCSATADSHLKLPLDQSARIAALQEWLAADARIIQQLNESNLKLKEENEKLTQKADYCILCNCDGCRVRFERESSTNRKA